jgi:hypothetical protein
MPNEFLVLKKNRPNSPPSHPLDDLRHPSPVVVPLGLDARRQVLAQHVGLHQPVAVHRQETNRHDEAQERTNSRRGDDGSNM